MRRFILALGLFFVLSSCNGGEVERPPTEVSGEGSLAPTSELDAEAADEPEMVELDEKPSAGAKTGLPGILLLTPMSGGGARPILEWSAVEGAEHYFVRVMTPEGRGYWAWRTDETSVPVGGFPRLNQDAAGPSIITGMTWSVVAVDGDGGILAASNNRPISP